MRPLELTIEGFKSYRDPVTFSFESRDLFGIVGPTGAGKSSILDALIFALYGKTPKVERDTGKLINSNCEQARVHLIFEVDDAVWELTRIIRTKGQGQFVLKASAGGDPVSGRPNVNDKVTQLLGLDFDAFCSSVSLPQGQFDQFLRATPGDRSKILKGVFRLERVDELRQAARGRSDLIEGQIRTLRSLGEGLPDDPLQVLNEATDQLGRARLSADEVRRAVPEVTGAEQELEVLASGIERAEEKKAGAIKSLEALPTGAVLEDLAAREDAISGSLGKAKQSLDEATKALGIADKRVAEVEEATGGQTWIASVESALKETDRLQKAMQTMKQEVLALQTEIRACEKGVMVAESAHRAAAVRVESSGAAVDQLRSEHAAHALRVKLKPGEKCPVCEQSVAKVPARKKVPALASAEKDLEKVRTDETKARAILVEAKQSHALAVDRLGSAAARLTQVGKELTEGLAELTSLVGKRDPTAELGARRNSIDEVQTALKSARAARDVAEAAERKARADWDDLAGRRAKLTLKLSHVCGALGVDAAVIEDEGLAGATKRATEAGQAIIERCTEQIETLKTKSEQASGLVSQFLERYGATKSEHAFDVLTRFKSQVAGLELRVKEIESAITKRKESEKQITQLAAEQALYRRLFEDLADAKFPAYLLEGRRLLLSKLASEKLLELTGHYIFDDEGDFAVIDQRTGVTRTSDTLSGGETFLASLALALGLAEAVALEGGRLGCFFLDEGFGSLDLEMLDQALEGIEAIATPGRLIGLISHHGGVQARLDDLIVLERGPDGTTEVLQHEGPRGFGPTMI